MFASIVSDKPAISDHRRSKFFGTFQYAKTATFTIHLVRAEDPWLEWFATIVKRASGGGAKIWTFAFCSPLLQ